MFENLLRRLRGEKRTPQEILKYHRQQNSAPSQETYQPPRETYSPPPPERVENFLSISNGAEFDEYLSRLKNISALNEFTGEAWVRTYLNRAAKNLSEIAAMNDFENDDFNFNLAKKVRAVSKHLLTIYRDARNSTSLDKNFRQNLMNAVENYLAEIGVEKKIFRSGDAFEDWADYSYGIINTADRALGSKIADVEVQPHMIFYLDDRGEVSELIFGGYCTFYQFVAED